jgi:pimeloyl-ACP methyl ester carboxylesterase
MKTTNPAELTSASSAVITTGSVTSRDGTRIGYLRLGQGPAAVLLHGSKESARSHLQLALALADAFTLYLPDRRGRGMSGPHGAGHGARAEVDDLAAVVAESGAQMVFAVSISAMIALEAARTRPAIRKVAAYEPALLMDRTAYTGWLSRFDQEMAEGRVDAALITSIRLPCRSSPSG